MPPLGSSIQAEAFLFTQAPCWLKKSIVPMAEMQTNRPERARERDAKEGEPRSFAPTPPGTVPTEHAGAGADKDQRRLDRLFGKISNILPKSVGDALRWLREPQARWVRIPAGVLLVIGGIFSILPVLGIWMLPLGLLLLAVDIPILRRPLAKAIVIVQRRWATWRRKPEEAA